MKMKLLRRMAKAISSTNLSLKKMHMYRGRSRVLQLRKMVSIGGRKTSQMLTLVCICARRSPLVLPIAGHTQMAELVRGLHPIMQCDAHPSGRSSRTICFVLRSAPTVAHLCGRRVTCPNAPTMHLHASSRTFTHLHAPSVRLSCFLRTECHPHRNATLRCNADSHLGIDASNPPSMSKKQR